MISISETSQTGRSSTRTEARIEASQAHIVRETPSERRSATVALPQGVRFDVGAALLRSWDPIAAPRLEFDNFSIDAMDVERIVIEAAPGSAPDAQGRITALRKRYEGSELRAVARIVLGADRGLVEVVQPMFGATMRIRPTDRATATAPRAPYRLLPNVMTRSPFRISPSAAQGHIRYRFAFREGIEFSLPQTGEQRVAAEAGGATVDICSNCGPGRPADAAALEEALRPAPWLQSDHPRLRALALPVARMQISDARKMELLLQRARPYLARIDFTGHYSALETLSRRAGDCTEAAVLLAALGRAAGIPTRVVNGLIYSRERYHGVSNAFMPHSWTLAWVDGQWKSFDLAFDAFDSTHIALTVGDGDPRSVAAAGQLASLLRWESMAEIRTGLGR
jgi:transglutaminase-like putative cysteine protease